MWPGRPAAWASTPAARRRISSRSASSTAGIEIALHGPVGPDQVPGGVQIDPPIDADHVAAGLGHQRQQGRIAGREMDHRHAGSQARRSPPAV